MSAQGMMLTVLATQIAEAVAKDETPEVGGCDISAGMFGPNFSTIIRDLVHQLDEHAQLLRAVEALIGAREQSLKEYCGTEFFAGGMAALQPYRDLVAKAKGGAA